MIKLLLLTCLFLALSHGDEDKTWSEGLDEEDEAVKELNKKSLQELEEVLDKSLAIDRQEILPSSWIKGLDLGSNDAASDANAADHETAQKAIVDFIEEALQLHAGEEMNSDLKEVMHEQDQEESQNDRKIGNDLDIKIDEVDGERVGRNKQSQEANDNTEIQKTGQNQVEEKQDDKKQDDKKPDDKKPDDKKPDDKKPDDKKPDDKKPDDQKPDDKKPDDKKPDDQKPDDQKQDKKPDNGGSQGPPKQLTEEELTKIQPPGLTAADLQHLVIIESHSCGLLPSVVMVALLPLCSLWTS